MVLWLKKHKTLLCSVLVSFLLATLFTYPYLKMDFLPIEHDTFFHLSRIEGLAKSLQHGICLPSIYPDKNNGFGYASPLFYCDVLLIPFALLYLMHVPLAVCYKILIFVSTFLASFTMMHLIHHVTKKEFISWILAAAYTFSNYHITDVYVRGAVGEVMAMIFLPILVEGLYRLFYEQDTAHDSVYTIGVAGLLLCHNLTFAMGVVLSIVFFCLNWKRINREVFRTTCKAVLFAFLLTVFFTLPMLEQLKDNQYYLNYYGSSSDLAVGSLPLWKYFANQTIFGYSNHDLEKNRQMLLNVGYFLQFVPLAYFGISKKNTFATHSLLLGYLCLLLPMQWIPWESLSFLRILQFPWRLLQLSMVLLCIPAAFVLMKVQHTSVLYLLSFALCAEGMYHVLPVQNRTFGLPHTMTWQEVTQGALCDPYYSATYMRVELAGGDYLPIDSVDYRNLPSEIMDASYQPCSIPIQRSNLSLTFTCDDSIGNSILLLPKTYYKGYHLYHVQDGQSEEITIRPMRGLVSFEAEGDGTYILQYKDTWLKKICMLVSMCTFLIWIRQKKWTS